MLTQTLLVLIFLSSRSVGQSEELRPSRGETEDSKLAEIRVGFLAASRRLKQDQSYARPGRQLLQVFNHGIRHINQLYANSNSSTRGGLKFMPIVAETYGSESESIKQTVHLISNSRVHFLIGPQETCQVEAEIAGAFRVPMISYYCSPNELPASAVAEWAPTFVQTKPPPWKIVSRVLTLISRLLDEPLSRYPQRLVLLYFQQPLNVADRWLHPSGRSSDKLPGRADASAQMANDAIQYEQIGRLLEIKLNELIGSRLAGQGSQLKTSRTQLNHSSPRATDESAKQTTNTLLAPLTVLNWHTTFHFGFTKNPFRRLIRQHLFGRHQKSHSAANQSQCSPVTQQATTGPPAVQSAAIYIVVGHYYEHLGLMLALNELQLLTDNESERSTVVNRPLQSSVSINHQQQQQQQQQRHHPSARVNQVAGRASLVIGVDVEQYDERDDSVRFLRGLLMDNAASTGANQRPSASFAELDASLSAAYRHYLAVTPGKPARTAELLREMHSPAPFEGANLSTLVPLLAQPSAPELAAATNQTLESLQLAERLLHLIRLPVEAFYLLDALHLLATYLHECVWLHNSTLARCADGQRVVEWFSGRQYTSSLGDPSTNFDDHARADGSYMLIVRKPTNESSAINDDDELSLTPIGRFSGDSIELLQLDPALVDPVWLPLWCSLARKQNASECAQLTVHANEPDGSSGSDEQQAETINFQVGQLAALTAASLLAAACLLLYCLSLNGYQYATRGVQNANRGWFGEQDERNFLEIVHRFLLAPDFSPAHASLADDDGEDGEDSAREKEDNGDQTHSTVRNHSGGLRTEVEELHCHMFPFPSCKFVHWISALHQLKELMFQYQSAGVASDSRGSTSQRKPLGAKSFVTGLLDSLYDCQIVKLRGQVDKEFDGRPWTSAKTGGFFSSKHRGTATLRLLMHKYKSLNESLCQLSHLEHHSVVRLFGVSLACTGLAKIAHLIVEQPERGNLRQALQSLGKTLEPLETGAFRQQLVPSLLEDILDGLEYLHASAIKFHGELSITKCLLTSHWRLRLSGFHANHMRRALGDYEQKYQRQRQQQQSVRRHRKPRHRTNNQLTDSDMIENFDTSLIYSAPEILLAPNQPNRLSWVAFQLADIYSFAFVLYELLAETEPWRCLTQVDSCKLISERVKVDAAFRPPLSRLDKAHYQSAPGRASVSLTSPSSLPGDQLVPSSSRQALLSPQHLQLIPKQHDFMAPLERGQRQNSRRVDMDVICRIIRSCWSHCPERRPQSVGALRNRLESSRLIAASLSPICKADPQPNSCVEHVYDCHADRDKAGDLSLINSYAKKLERISIRSREQLGNARQKNLELRLNSLPQCVAMKLLSNTHQTTNSLTQQFECVNFCFFRLIIAPEDCRTRASLFGWLNECLAQLDALVATYRRHIQLVDSQVDSSLRYMIYSGEALLSRTSLPNSGSDSSVGKQKSIIQARQCQLVASFALQLVDLANRWCSNKQGARVQARCSLHCGPVIGGLLSPGFTCYDKEDPPTSSLRGSCDAFTNLGNCSSPNGAVKQQLFRLSTSSSLPRYVLIGQTMQIADTLESTSQPQRIQISTEYRQQLLKSIQQSNLTGLEHTDGLFASSRQSYVIIKREGRIQAKNTADLEAYWLLNGPRLTASQSIMLTNTLLEQ